MEITLARIDNRLLHGVVATQWAPHAHAQRVMIIDDKTAEDPLAKASMKLARPAGAALSIITIQKALDNFKADTYKDQSIFIITKEPSTLLRLITEAEVPINEINVGATAQRSDLDDVIEVNHRVTIDEQEKKDYQALLARGVHISIQYLLSDKPQSMDQVLA